MHRLELKIPPPLVGLAVALLMWAAARMLPGLDFDLPARRALALFAATLALAVDVAALWRFVRVRTTVNPLRPEQTSTLVTDGVYAVTRNPMYLGMALWLVAWGLWLANAASMASIAVFVLWIDRLQIRPEERALAARYGEAFEQYRTRVRRWV